MKQIIQRSGFARIFRDMMLSKAWNDLTTRQMGLYLLFKNKFVVSDTRDNNKNNITLTCSEVEKAYKHNMKGLRKDIDSLIEHGFIKQISSGYFTRTPNIYGFSDKWKKYGTEDFKIEEHEKRYRRNKKG